MKAPDRALPDAAYKFTDLFGGLENALRSTGWCKNDRDRAEADWRRFAREKLGDAFYQEVQRRGIADTLTRGRPRTRMRQDLAFKPDEALPIANIVELFVDGVCQVRNNIEHRHKFRGDEESIDRDHVLIGEAHSVLRLVLELYPDLAAHL